MLYLHADYTKMHRFLAGEVAYLFRDKSAKWCFCRCCFPVAIPVGMKGVELTHPRSKAIRSVANLRHVDGSILALRQWKSRKTTDPKDNSHLLGSALYTLYSPC